MIDGILFDKDGTLFDFDATWSHWASDILRELSAGDAALEAQMAARLDFDLGQKRFRPGSVVIAGTGAEVTELLADLVPGYGRDALEDFLSDRAAEAPQVSPVPLAPLLDGLRARGLQLGVMTNDAERAARAHLGREGVLDRFRAVIGFDSGYGGKPAPDPLLAFAEIAGLDPSRVVMVGDSLHDLVAGRAAGMRRVAVLTGIAGAEELAPHAETVLPDIGHLPGWLDSLAAGAVTA
ncbi:HAD family hydrolase [Maritimibacter alkaliphilus]|uniref:HAD family hydrolase n=1 Tax=Maritimibacter alkaliphilus TaxID=404236 RepID=UPI001C960D0D|nr:HAD family hydrolase [Maritimibacter alkaliphilus]MBY6089102.1 HAD family hydrolase [Maritimibacter alkaliphilus]